MTDLRPPRGTFDVLPADQPARLRILDRALGVLDRAGYGRIDTPMFEHTGVFSRGVGASTDIVRKEMFGLSDTDDELTLRPEGTAAVARAYLTNGLSRAPSPLRLCYAGAFFRRETPQSGRFRQFTQVGAEMFGAAGPHADAELVALCAELLDACGVRDLTLRLGTLGCAPARAAYRRQLVDYVGAREAELPAALRDPQNSWRENPLRLFDAKDETVQAVMAAAPRLLDSLSADDRDYFAQVCAALDAAGVGYEVDATLVRGLDYYSHTVFEFCSGALGAQSAVGGGGRYDTLVQLLGGPVTPAVGFAVGVERILLACGLDDEPQPGPQVTVAAAGAEYATAAFTLARGLRARGLRVTRADSGRSLKAQVKRADRDRSDVVAICGAEGVSVKDLRSGSQTVCGADPVAEIIARLSEPTR